MTDSVRPKPVVNPPRNKRGQIIKYEQLVAFDCAYCQIIVIKRAINALPICSACLAKRNNAERRSGGSYRVRRTS